MLDPVLNPLLDLIREHGPLLLFVAAFLENAAFMSWLVPGEKLVAVGGYFVQRGELRFELAWLCVFLGVLCGDHVGFADRAAGRATPPSPPAAPAGHRAGGAPDPAPRRLGGAVRPVHGDRAAGRAVHGRDDGAAVPSVLAVRAGRGSELEPGLARDRGAGRLADRVPGGVRAVGAVADARGLGDRRDAGLALPRSAEAAAPGRGRAGPSGRRSRPPRGPRPVR